MGTFRIMWTFFIFFSLSCFLHFTFDYFLRSLFSTIYGKSCSLCTYHVQTKSCSAINKSSKTRGKTNFLLLHLMWVHGDGPPRLWYTFAKTSHRNSARGHLKSLRVNKQRCFCVVFLFTSCKERHRSGALLRGSSRSFCQSSTELNVVLFACAHY